MLFSESLQLILKAEQRKAGFHLGEDEHFLYLYNKEGKIIGIFSSCGATIPAIQNEVDTLMKV